MVWRSVWCLVFILIVNQSAGVAQDRPNIVFILADDLGYGDIGVYGQEKIETPNLDALAKNGMLFTDFYAGAPVCAPSRSSLLTGQHTGHTYIRGNKEIEPEGQLPLPARVETFAKQLQKQGYTNGAFGKWGLGMVGTSGDPLNQGFDEFFGYNCQRHAHRYYPTHLWHNGQRINLEGNDMEHTVTYAPDLIQEHTLSFIHQNRDRPFFLFVPSVLPHAELLVPDDSLFSKYDGRFAEKPYQGRDYGPGAGLGYTSQEKPRSTFATMVSRLDSHVGAIVEALAREGILERTIIIFTSDNGAHREGGADPDFFNSSGPLRGYKRDLYEGGLRVPMIVQWPGHVEAGQINEHIGAFWDIGPTVLEIAGAEPLADTDGLSFLPTLTGSVDQAEHEYLYWEFHEQGGKQAVRIGDYKAIRLQAMQNPDAEIELYHLPTDIGEQRNLSDQHPVLIEKAAKMMREARREQPLFPFWD